MTRILAIVSQKGGVGKTSLVQNLGAELARAGQHVLLIDFDPQSNLTMGWGLNPMEERATIYGGMNRPDSIRDCIVPLRPRLDLAPADLDLAGAELAYIHAIDRNYKLRKALQPIVADYDVVLVDSPPSLSFFTINALVAANELILPLQVHPYAYKAIDQLLSIVEQVREINPTLRLTGVVLTMYDSRNSLTGAIEEAARRRFGSLLFEAMIPVNVRIAEATLDGVSVNEYEAESKGAQAYYALAQEVMYRGKA